MPLTYFRHNTTGDVFTTDDPQFWETAATKLTAREGTAALADQARAKLRKMLGVKGTVYGNLQSVSRSGMMRKITLHVVENGSIRNITSLVRDAVPGFTTDRDGYLVRPGCGTDALFSAVYALGTALWPNGTEEPHGTRNGEPDTFGGYALNYQWL